MLEAMLHPKRSARWYEELKTERARAQEIFWEQTYYWLVQQLKPGTTVLDIGANIGDTAIYFAQFDKVAKVMAYEPVPYTYDFMLAKLKTCPLAHKIVPKREAVSNADSSMRVSDSYMDSRGESIETMGSASGVKVRITSLNSALHGLRNVAIKCDAEGAEETMFDNADLSEVYAVILEWHGLRALEGSRQALEKAGFRTTCQKLSDGIPLARPWDVGTGLLHATKAGKG